MMRVDRIKTDGAADESSFTGTWRLDNANPDTGLRYLRRFTLALPTAGITEDLLFAESTRLRLRARHLVFDALDGQAPERAQLRNATGGVRLTLPLARVIHSIHFIGAAAAGGKTTQLFRVDGDVIADEPAMSYTNPAARGGTYRRTTGGKPVAEAGVAAPTAHGPAVKHPDSGITASVTDDRLGGLPGGELGLVDREVVVRLDSADPIGTGDISSVHLSSGPENLRVSVRLPALGDEAVPLPLAFILNRQIDAGDALRDQLEALVRRLRDRLAEENSGVQIPTLPDPLLFELDLESDAPCRFEIDHFAVDYRLLRESFPTGEPKQVLRFAGDQLDRQRLTIQLPGGANLHQADIRIHASTADDAAATGASHQGESPGMIAAAADGRGLRIDARHGWSSPIDLVDAQLARGLDLLLGPLQTGVRLRLELVGDTDGMPGGERLGLAEGTAGPPGTSQWQRLVFQQAILLQPGVYWLTLISLGGAAIWYTRPSVGHRALHVGDDQDGAIAEDQAGIASWLAADGPARTGQEVPAISLNGQRLSASVDGRQLVYDLMPGITPNTGPVGTLLDVDLEILGSGPGPMTLYPPRLVFETVSNQA